MWAYFREVFLMPMPELPADFSGMSNADLAEVAAELRRFWDENRTNASTPEAVAELRQVRDGIVALNEELQRRDTELEELDGEVADLFGESGEGSGAAPAPEGEAVAAAAGRPAAPPRDPNSVPLSGLARYRPAAVAARPERAPSAVRMVTAAGAVLPDRDALVMHMAHALEGRTPLNFDQDGKAGVASIEYDHPEGRVLGNDSGRNMALIASAVSAQLAGGRPQALTAASILCAPTQPYYEQVVLAGSDRPVRDALVAFGSERGGIRYMPPPVMADVASGVTTVAADPGTTSKPCVLVACPSEQEVQVTAVPSCIEFDNFNARAWPERVRALLAVGAAQQAKVAETYLLDGIATASTAVTAAKGYGAGRQLLANIGTAAAGYRSRNRMPRDAVVQVLLPSWVPDIMRADYVRSFTDELDMFAVTDEQIAAFFANNHIQASYYLDSKTGGGQVFAAQTGGPLLPFPNNMFAYLFAPGTFLHIDGGTLDFGLIRDSVLNAANKYRMMTETFENVAKVGVESIELRATICADGTYAPSATALTCPA